MIERMRKKNHSSADHEPQRLPSPFFDHPARQMLRQISSCRTAKWQTQYDKDFVISRGDELVINRQRGGQRVRENRYAQLFGSSESKLPARGHRAQDSMVATIPHARVEPSLRATTRNSSSARRRTSNPTMSAHGPQAGLILAAHRQHRFVKQIFRSPFDPAPSAVRGRTRDFCLQKARRNPPDRNIWLSEFENVWAGQPYWLRATEALLLQAPMASPARSAFVRGTAPATRQDNRRLRVHRRFLEVDHQLPCRAVRMTWPLVTALRNLNRRQSCPVEVAQSDR